MNKYKNENKIEMNRKDYGKEISAITIIAVLVFGIMIICFAVVNDNDQFIIVHPKKNNKIISKLTEIECLNLKSAIWSYLEGCQCVEGFYGSLCQNTSM